MRTKLLVSAMALTTAIGVVWASGDWSAAKSKADDYKSKHQELERLAAGEAKRVVEAACVAERDQRSHADDVASSARSRVGDKFRDLERLERDAIDRLEHVIGDTSLASNRDQARNLESEIKSSWERLSGSTRLLRERSRDIVDGFVHDGESAMRDHAGRCDAKDVSLSSGHATCLMASGGDTCKIVEFAPNDSSAISRARDRGQRIRSSLERFDGDTVKRLIGIKSDFAKCKRFEVRVDCYKACGEVSDRGEIRHGSASWREGC